MDVVNGGGGGDPTEYLVVTDPLLSIAPDSKHHLSPPDPGGALAVGQCFSKFASAAFFFFVSTASHIKSTFPFPHTINSFGQLKPITPSTSSSSSSNCSQHYTPSCFTFPHQSLSDKVSTFPLNFLLRAAAEYVQPLSVLSLAAAFLSPLHHSTPNVLAIPPEDAANIQMLGSLSKNPSNARHRGCVANAFLDFKRAKHAVEPITGIHFPAVLNTILAKGNQSNFSSEVLVGTGSRIMTVIRIKSLKVYAFGFYVHPSSVCQKLGSKYGSVPAVELKERNDFYADLLREDIGMTVRLVVNYNGMKISTVKDAFEKALRARLAKTNPETDFKCIARFGSYFTNDIPLPVGTIIDFRRTADGQLITEIGGNQIGTVHSRELCRAFFDMYIGEVPVSEQTKEQIGRNVATIIGRC